MSLFNSQEIEVLSAVIIALESGGAVYGNGDWSAFAEAYANSSAEHAITIGAGQWYGVEALKLLKKIYETDSATFKRLDTAGVYNDFGANWSTYNISKSSAKATAIKNIISSEVGKKCQKLLLGEQMEEYAQEAYKLGVTETDALAECCNFRHQGGYGAMSRVIGKTSKPYTLDNLYKAVLTDNVPNQVGTYTSRQNNFYKMIKAHWPYNGVSVNAQTTTTTKETTINTPTTTTPNKTSAPSKVVQYIGYIKSTITPRTWADSSSSAMKSVKSLVKNESVGVCCMMSDSKGVDWCYILIQNKYYGFVPAAYVSKTEIVDLTERDAISTTNNSSAPSKTVKWTGTVTATSLYVRKWAGTENAPLISCPIITYGTKVEVCDIVSAKDGSAWYYIKTPKGTYGFSSAQYISKA